MLQKILDTAAEKTWQVTSVNLDSGMDQVGFLKVVQDLEKKKEYNIILDCELERLNLILNLVNNIRLIDSPVNEKRVVTIESLMNEEMLRKLDRLVQ